jgi:UDP-N-acetylmuramoyl-tripeptide--D-alanyl-D-alanine ligase
MTTPLWTWDALSDAVPFAAADGTPNRAITGFSIDTRSLQSGDVFVALKDQRDGHEFVTAAFNAGAAAALVAESYQRKTGDGALLRSARNVLKALEVIGVAARHRLAPSARVIAVTGSAGKTGTKEMLRECLSAVAPGAVHASEKSYNNHWGVPLTLARMPADTEYAVIEIGMNHAGEIVPLTKMVEPHAAIVTTVEAVHLEHFGSVEDIADAKAEIFQGLVPGGAAIIKRDNPHFDRLRVRAEIESARVVSFAIDAGADVSAIAFLPGDDGSEVTARVRDKLVTFRLAIPGRHIVENALGVIAALDAAGADVETAVSALATLAPPGGRGLRTRLFIAGGDALLIDESYNANPASMRAALATLATVPRAKFPRRIAVLGDMLELGAEAAALHRGLKDAVDEAGVDLIFACGPHMKGLYDAGPSAMKGGYGATASMLEASLQAALRPGDVVMIKASNGMRLAPVVEALKVRFGRPAASG